MRNEFPKVNDKFYLAGQRCPTLRKAVEVLSAIPQPGHPFEQAAYEAHESNVFSVVVGFVDGVLARLR